VVRAADDDGTPGVPDSEGFRDEQGSFHFSVRGV
jgi:hypothetical protein